MTDNTAPTAPQPRRKAYSYLRFSTPQQSEGHSFQRQWDKTVAYAAENGLELDRELVFHDEGVSAYRSTNATTGRLGAFLEAVHAGQVERGSVLLVESLDRISRDNAFDAQVTLSNIVSSGVSLVTLIDQKEYSLEVLRSDPMTMFYVVALLIRANDESKTKAHRVGAAWAALRERAARPGSKPITAKLPAWLRLSADRERIEAVPERADLVQRMFAMTLAGVGQHSIAETFNRESIEPWGPGKRKATMWHRSYIAKTLANQAVIGTYQPHTLEFDGAKKRRRPQEPILNYFPQVVPGETFDDVQAIRDVRGGAARGRHAVAPITNILARLARCPKCSAAMTRVNKGKRSKPAYICTRAKIGKGCAYHAVPCATIEQGLVFGLPARLRAFEGVAGGGAELDAAVEAASDRVDLIRDRIEGLLDDLIDEPSPAVSRRIRELEADLEGAKDALRQLVDRQELATGKTIGARIERALSALEPAEGDPSPAAINLALRALFNAAVINWPDHAVDLEWTHGGTCSVPYSAFTKWPGPGWVWHEEENDNGA